MSVNTTEAKIEHMVVTAFKAFDAKLQCRGFQYEVGKTYRIPEGQHPVRCGAVGFHSCEAPFDVFSYYPMIGSRFAIVEASGEIARDGADTKIASAEITIKVELTLPEFIKRAADWIVKAAKGNTATGDYGHAAATGNYGHAAATGYRGHAAATGDSGHAAVKGKHAIAIAAGYAGTASAEAGGAIMLAAYDDSWNLVAVFASKVGENGIEPGKTYRLRQDGTPELVEAA